VISAGAAGIALALTATACAPSEPGAEEVTSVRMSVLNYFLPATWDTSGGFVTTYFMPTQAVYESLFQLNPANYEYEPMLAESYVIADDRRSMTLELREDVDFTDGEHLDAAAAKASIEAVLAGPTYFQAQLRDAFGMAVEAVDEYTLEITTSRGMSSRFMDALAILPIASPIALEDPETLATTPAGTGPYVVDEQTADVSISYVRNPDYRDPGAYPFDQLEFVVFADNIAAANALKSGQLDVAMLDAGLVADVEAAGFDIHVGGGLVYTLYWMDRAGTVQPALADPRVRQAISYAIDREGITEQIALGYGRVTSQTFIEGQPEYVGGGDDRYPYDPERARELMAEAGYADGFDLELPTWNLYAPYEPVLQQMLADIGIRVTYERVADNAAHYEAFLSGDYAMTLFGTGDTYWISELEQGGKMNIGSGAPDPEIADVLERIANGSADDSAAASRELGEFLLEQQWYIPISRQFDIYGSIPDVRLEVGDISGIYPILSGLRPAE
jgi:peptide/nickel transport system substrate-binding protein